MTERQHWWPYLLAILSALLAPTALQHALEPASGNQTQEKAASQSSPASPTTNVPADGKNWLEFLCSYATPRQAGGGYCEGDRAPDAEYLIAGVPDPEATSVPGTFDVMIEAIIGAAAAEGWRYDRNWLPWGTGVGKAGESPAKPALANDQPGLLLFRNKDAQLLLIFLVGETPTSGVNKTALYQAGRFILARGGTLRLLGPRFSGSIPSYKQTLDLLTNRSAIKARLVSGSATAPGNAAALKPHSYEATVEQDERTRDLFLAWLKQRAISPSEVAMLSEVGTAFGAAFREGDNNAVLQIEFPYQISRLRNAYEKDPELRALGRDQAAAGTAGQLAWSLTTEREDTDRVRTFHGPQTTLLQERQLAQITDQITGRGIRVVGINATDVLDTVFLTLQLRRACPDVRVFTLDSDLLFTYSKGALTFNGMLMVSPYPLWPESPHLHTSPNRSALGVHNAFVHLMGGTAYRDYWSPDGGARPAIWVSAVGRGRLWPLAVLSDGEETSQLVKVETAAALPPLQPRPDLPYWLSLGAFSLLVSYGLFVYASRRIAELGWLGGSFDPAFFFVLEPPDRTIERTIYVQLLCSFGFAAFLPFTAHTGWWLCAAAIFVFVYTTFHEPRRALAVLSAAVVLVPAAVATPFWYTHLQNVPFREWERFFFDFRLVHPASGISPLPSWTLAWFGCAWWAVMRISQLRTREVRSPRLESWPADEPLLSGMSAAARKASYAGRVNGLARSFVIALTLSGLLLCWTLPEGLWSLEVETAWASWARGVYLGLILLTILLLLVIAQLVDTQSAALDILHGLEDHPLGDAFARLPKELAASGLWARGTNRHPFQSCLHAVKRLREIPGAVAQWSEAEQLLSAALARSAAGLRANSGDVAALHCRLNEAAFALYPGVAAQWKHGEKAHAVTEEFVALRLGALLRHLVMQMRSGIEYLSAGLVLLILAVIAYPLEPQKGLVYMVTAVVAATGVIVVYAVTKVDNHPVMRKFASQEGAPSFLDTIRKVAGLGLPPTIATFTALFPGSVRSLSTLIDAASKYLGAP